MKVSELIWRTARIEIRNLTEADCTRILKGDYPADTPGRAHIRQVVENVRDAWDFLAEHEDEPVDWMFLGEYNRLCGRNLVPDAGRMRTHPVRMTGTRWMPRPLVAPDDVYRSINLALDEPTVIRRACRLFMEACRGQWFNDGNKRTACMAANHLLAHGHAGCFAIPPDVVDTTFPGLLLDWYETDEPGPLMGWLQANAIL